jgi:hypothetical protein
VADEEFFKRLVDGVGSSAVQTCLLSQMICLLLPTRAFGILIRILHLVHPARSVGSRFKRV